MEKNIKTYQELTYKGLDKLIKKECDDGNSMLFLATTGKEYYIGDAMKSYLQDIGFTLYCRSHVIVTISW